MGKSSRQSKILHYLESDQYSKFKNYIKKHRISVSKFELDDNYNSLLHVACSLGQFHTVSYLIKSGADVLLVNRNGETPLHKACFCAAGGNREAYWDIVPLLLKHGPEALHMEDIRGISPHELLKDIHQPKTKPDETTEDNEDHEWNEKLAAEMEAEYSESMNGFHTNDNTFETHESYNDWADRINREHFTKNNQPRVSRKRAPDTQPNSSGRAGFSEEKKKKFEKKMRDEYLAQKKQMKMEVMKDAKHDYESKCKELFSSQKQTKHKQWKYSEIPFPMKRNGKIEDIKDYLLCDLDSENKSAIKKYLREQQIRWHPDKFLQRCGSSLREKDRDRILNKVKEVSQELNHILSTL